MRIGVESAMALGSATLLGALGAAAVYAIEIWVTRVPKELDALSAKKIDLKIELTGIKSIQLEFVKHSLLSRNLIKTEKQIESLSAAHRASTLSLLKYVNASKIAILIALSICLRENIAVFAEKNMLWPFSFLFVHFQETVEMFNFPVVVITCFSYLMTRMLMEVFRSTVTSSTASTDAQGL